MSKADYVLSCICTINSLIITYLRLLKVLSVFKRFLLKYPRGKLTFTTSQICLNFVCLSENSRQKVINFVFEILKKTFKLHTSRWVNFCSIKSNLRNIYLKFRKEKRFKIQVVFYMFCAIND
jgi:hypothetical protein